MLVIGVLKAVKAFDHNICTYNELLFVVSSPRKQHIFVHLISIKLKGLILRNGLTLMVRKMHCYLFLGLGLTSSMYSSKNCSFLLVDHSCSRHPYAYCSFYSIRVYLCFLLHHCKFWLNLLSKQRKLSFCLVKEPLNSFEYMQIWVLNDDALRKNSLVQSIIYKV